MSGDPVVSPFGESEAGRYHAVAAQVVAALLEIRPDEATDLGDHRFDDRMPDLSEDGTEAHAVMLGEALGALDDVDDTVLGLPDRVDLDLLRTKVAGDLWTVTELAPQLWDPLVHVPAGALYPLLSRVPSRPEDRVRALAARLADVPRHLAVAQHQLREMPRVHVETAIAQTRGTASLLGTDVDRLLAQLPDGGPRSVRALVDDARSAAHTALADHAAWLTDRLPDAVGDPRLGDQVFAARLWYGLDTETTPDALLTRAESDLMAVEEQITEVAERVRAGGRLEPDAGGSLGSPGAGGVVRTVLDAVARSAPSSAESILELCRTALTQLTDGVREHDLVTVREDPVQIIEMPEARRGTAVAYCDPPGALEDDGPSLPTFYAVAPAPRDWPVDQVASFHREYNRFMVHNLSAHEGVPGHLLQLAHARRYRGATPVRRVLSSGTFIEGWAVYAEQLVAQAGIGVPEADRDLVLLQQLKMQLRVTINAILDIRVHSHGMTETEAMALMMRRGHQEEAEAAGKWRRALLTSGQLSTYYVGYREVADLAADVTRARSTYTVRQVHDALLAHGSPPPRHLRTLLQL